MKNSSKKGFTLIETIISICIFTIASVGVYQILMNIIKTTKYGEQKQSIAVIGKSTLEKLKNLSNDNIEKVEDGIKLKEINFSDEESMKDLTMAGDMEKFSKNIYLNKTYEYCSENSSECEYEEEIVFEKVKSKLNGSYGNGDADIEDEQEINIDMKLDDSEEDVDELKEKANDINIDKFFICKREGESSRTEIKKEGTSKNLDNKEFNIYIENKEEDEVEITVENSDNELFSVQENLAKDKLNNINIYFNFKDYKNEKNEVLSDFKINVYNKLKNKKYNNRVNIYIEKSSEDYNVQVNRRAKGEINRLNRNETGEIQKVGPLYNIKVKIAKKGSLNSTTEKALFTGYAAKNINIEEN